MIVPYTVPTIVQVQRFAIINKIGQKEYILENSALVAMRVTTG